MKPTVEERFLRFAPSGAPDACWLWLATKIGDMHYGGFKVAGVMHYAHRWAWVRANGPIPDGLKVLHTCDVPACVNPAHLFLGTQAANMADKVAKGRQAKGETHGSRTHPEAFKGQIPTRPASQARRKPVAPAAGMHTHPEARRPGESNGNSRLTAEQVRSLRADIAGGASQRAVGRKYGVSQTAVRLIVRRVIWRSIE